MPILDILRGVFLTVRGKFIFLLRLKFNTIDKSMPKGPKTKESGGAGVLSFSFSPLSRFDQVSLKKGFKLYRSCTK